MRPGSAVHRPAQARFDRLARSAPAGGAIWRRRRELVDERDEERTLPVLAPRTTLRALCGGVLPRRIGPLPAEREPPGMRLRGQDRGR